MKQAKQNETTSNAVIYCRTASATKKDNINSCVSQKARCEAFAKTKGYHVLICMQINTKGYNTGFSF